jgi:hypothetical protein
VHETEIKKTPEDLPLLWPRLMREDDPAFRNAALRPASADSGPVGCRPGAVPL